MILSATHNCFLRNYLFQLNSLINCFIKLFSLQCKLEMQIWRDFFFSLLTQKKSRGQYFECNLQNSTEIEENIFIFTIPTCTLCSFCVVKLSTLILKKQILFEHVCLNTYRVLYTIASI